VVYTEALGPAAYIGRARVVPLRNMGAAISPFNSFLILQGIETLAVRMDRICDNTIWKVAQFLQGTRRSLGQLRRPGRPSGPRRWSKYMGGRASGILTFGVKAGARRGARFQDALKLFTRLVNIGDAKSLACHPASTTHRQLVAGGACQGRRQRGHGAAVDRHRAHRRPDRGPRPGYPALSKATRGRRTTSSSRRQRRGAR
jgi:O-acetylhomoserine (thiol)-lyase